MIWVYSTFPSLKSAQKVSHLVLEKRLAACANIVPKMISFYWWKEKIQKSNEVVVIFKTQKKLYKKLETSLKELHPYSLPCILQLPIQNGFQSYLDWVQKETSSPAKQVSPQLQKPKLRKPRSK